jgi:hypothetical protein
VRNEREVIYMTLSEIQALTKLVNQEQMLWQSGGPIEPLRTHVIQLSDAMLNKMIETYRAWVKKMGMSPATEKSFLDGYVKRITETYDATLKTSLAQIDKLAKKPAGR